jgi:hypothetical protein
MAFDFKSYETPDGYRIRAYEVNELQNVELIGVGPSNVNDGYLIETPYPNRYDWLSDTSFIDVCKFSEVNDEEESFTEEAPTDTTESDSATDTDNVSGTERF